MKGYKMKDRDQLKNIIQSFGRARVLVIGDLMLDEYVWGKVSRISPEAPVPVVWVDKESFMPGGASNVANNIAALGGRVMLAGVVGNDERGRVLKKELKKKGIDTGGIFTDASRPTILKTRVIAYHQQVVRIDREKTEPMASQITSRLIKYIRNKMAGIDALVIEDYGKGVITPQLLTAIVRAARKEKKIIVVDPKEENFSYYKGITAITPNQQEASQAAGLQIKDEKTLTEAGKRIMKKLNCRIVLITRGELGMRLFPRGRKAVNIPTVAQAVFDVSGAGDTVAAAFSLALSCKAEPVIAAHIANYAAGIVVGKLGTATVSRNELLERIREDIKI